MSTTDNPSHILEQEIVANLLVDKHYFNSSIHHLQDTHFVDPGMRLLFLNTKNHYLNFGGVPSTRELILSFKDSSKQDKELIKTSIKDVQNSGDVNSKMLLELTEKFIKSAIFAKSIIMGADSLGSHNEDKMAESFALAEEAVSVNLLDDLGINLEDIDKVYDNFTDKVGIKLGIPSFDNMIGGGFTPKTLHTVMAASGVGKSAILSSFAVQFLLQKRDVVYVTLEMSESEMSKRIYANLYDIPITELKNIDKMVYKSKYQAIKNDIGNLNVKEFPTGSLSPLALDGYLTQLETEGKIKNPIVIVDYLGIMDSDKTKNRDNSYSFFGSIAEELRSVAQKRNLIIFTALQLNRSAVNNLEADQAALAESMRIYNIADSAFIIAQTAEMKEKSEMRINFVKNRLSGKTWSFNIKYDYHKFRIVDDFNIGGANVTNQDLKDPISGSVTDLGNLMSM